MDSMEYACLHHEAIGRLATALAVYICAHVKLLHCLST